jgi:hypothetical protein
MGASASSGGSMLGNIGAVAGIAGNAMGAYSGLQRGGVAGDTGAALSAIKGANSVDQLATGSGFLGSGASGALGAAGGALQIYNGLQQGGVQGDLSAAMGAAQTYEGVSAADAALGGSGLAGSSALAGLGVAAIPVAAFSGLYDVFNKNSTQTPEQIATMENNDAAMLHGTAVADANPNNSQQVQSWATGIQGEADSMSQLAYEALNWSPAQLQAQASAFVNDPTIKNAATPSYDESMYQHQNTQLS